MNPIRNNPIIHAVLMMTLVACQPADNTQSANKSELETATMNNPKPPVAKKVPHKMSIHGDTRIDNYYWMRNDERKAPEVIQHLEAENSFTEATLAHTTYLQEKLFKEINGRIKKDDSTVPFKKNGYFYTQRYEGDKEYPIYLRQKDNLDAKEEILLDGNKMAEAHDYFAIGDYEVSPDNKILAYSTDTLSRRVYTIEFKSLNDDQSNVNDVLTQTNGQIIWANDNQHVFYIKKDPQTLLGYQVYRHQLGTPQSDDSLVYEETNSAFYTSLGKTKDDSIIYIYHDSTDSSGASILDANRPTDDFVLFAPLEDKHEYAFEKLNDTFYIRTNWQAKNFRIMKASGKAIHDKTQWQEVIPHNPDVYIRDIELFQNYLVINEKENGVNRINVINWDDNKQHNIQFEDPVFVAGFTNNTHTDTDTLRLYYSSMTTPASVYDYNMKKQEKTLLKQQEVLGEFHPNNYQSERIFVKARDGKQIPVSLVYRKDKFKQDGTNPLYQYGYGSYGATIDPYFSGSRLSLLDRGFVFAIAHIRGSQMLGRPWYEDGKMFNKKNTFNDFVDVTRELVAQKYGAKDRVFAAGGSAGGLLMGAVINQAPELYKAIAAHVPFVDVVTTMLDESIPLTTNEYDEWGNPNNEDSYQYMLSYSPYDQISRQDYPHILVTTGLHDSQVQYFEPMKWIAKLREYNTSSNTIVFKTDLEAGHGGASGRFKRNRDTALEYAFFADLAGIKE
ncbi:S9 family peptidase [Pleionea mediterranea]|uniref:Oligopeptidase B n=1 Tax=Pleionea mediterranea TaxID=523701 RepID=A0A316FU83_9GAMM|nr:S9 family peptidase [Pleionea mediterranea]PWK44408.1 oligopeptidase B [Pleionea mediterranea]